jgi:hypothetical protein
MRAALAPSQCATHQAFTMEELAGWQSSQQSNQVDTFLTQLISFLQVQGGCGVPDAVISFIVSSFSVTHSQT